MSLKHTVIGTALVVGGGIGSLVGLGGTCAQMGDYNPIFMKEIYCKNGNMSEEKCKENEEAKNKQHKKTAAWFGAGVIALGLAYAGHRYRERGSQS